MQQVFSINDYRYQTIWIEDAPRFVGHDLNPYCLQRYFNINNFVEIVRKYLHFDQETLAGHVRCSYNMSIDPDQPTDTVM